MNKDIVKMIAVLLASICLWWAFWEFSPLWFSSKIKDLEKRIEILERNYGS